MPQYSSEEIQRKIDSLPQNVKAIYEGAETAEILQQIGKEHKLMLDQLGELADETGLVILGLTHPKDYISNLSSRLGVSKEESKKIAEEVNDKIFRRIREELKKIHGIEEEAESAAAAASVRPTIPPAMTPPETPKPYPAPVKEVIPPAAKAPAPPAVKVVPLKPFIAQAPSKPAEMPTVAPSPARPKTETAPEMMLPQAPRAPQPSAPQAAVRATPPPASQTQQVPTSPFEQKLAEDTIVRSAPAKYAGRDPYREPVE